MGLASLGERVKRGDIDYDLVKPTSSLFLACCRDFNIAALFNVLFGCFIAAKCSLSLQLQTGPLAYLQFSTLTLCGLAILFGIRLAMASLSFWIVETQQVGALFYQAYSLAMKPDFIYRGFLRIILMTAVPMILIASAPARALLGKPLGGGIAVPITAAIIFSGIGIAAFTLGLRRYTSVQS